MLGPIRKFSTSIYAKVLLIIIIIPFIFWGMGSAFKGGSKNVVVVIDKDKYSMQEFTNFMQKTATKEIVPNQIDGFLSNFIGEKLIEKEVNEYEINLSNISLSKLVKHQKEFKRDNKFSRTEYEKFLLKNNITAVNFESILLKQELKKQLIDLIGGGIIPSDFVVDIAYDKLNQKRNIKLINLNDYFVKNFSFPNEVIKNYFDKNKNKFTDFYKYINVYTATPKKLVTGEEFNDLFYKKIDEIDDLLINNKDLDYIVKEYNLGEPKLFILNESGKDKNAKKNLNIPKNVIGKILDLNDIDRTILVEDNNKYFVAGFSEIKTVERKLQDESVKNEIVLDLENITKRKLLSQIMSKINSNDFGKNEFNNFSVNENVKIQEIRLESINDKNILKKDIVAQIYKYPNKSVIIVNDLDLVENYLVFIENVEKVKVKTDANEYKKYFNLAKVQMMSSLYNTYDMHLKDKYKIDINYQSLEVLKNSFN